MRKYLNKDGYTWLPWENDIDVEINFDFKSFKGFQ